ncbi:TRAP transporter small permease subunit [Rhodovibrio sodomensis]|uniref:TRAP transporter small permease subunit n=1 Tax=Rhodovibrio sodomensis TaxID=1088 RepID=UPI0019039230
MGRLAAGVETVISVSAQAIVLVTMVTLFVTLFANAVLRYAFDSGISGTQELPQLAFPWLVLAGAVLAGVRGQQIAVDVLLRALPGWWKIALAILINAVVLVLSVAVVDAAVTMAESAHSQVSPILKIPRSYGYAGLIYGYGCLAVVALTNSVRAVAEGPQGGRGAS